MKKLLNTLAIVTLLGSSTASVVACGNGKGPIDPGTTEGTQKQMLQGAEFISRLIVGGRHENLNYNINEILSIFLASSPTAMNMPLSYKNHGNNINMANEVNLYRNLLAPSLNYYNGDGYAGMFASYVMGMYENDFYDEIINGGTDGTYYFNDTFSKSGNQGYNKKDNNAMGYAAGLGKNIDLSSNEQRKNLAWGIQDTGALTNYLLDLGFDGANPTDTNGSAGPKSSASEKVGTNGSGYAWYNSILMSGKASQSSDFKPKDNPVTNKMVEGTNFKSADKDNKSNINGNDFNSTGALITKTAGKQNVNGFISLFGSMLDNISETRNGALVLAEFLNILFPMITGAGLTNAATVMQAVGMSLISNVWAGIKNIKDTSIINDQEIVDMINELDSAPAPLINLPFVGTSPNPSETLKIERFYSISDKDDEKKGGIQGTNARNIIKIIEKLVNYFENSNNKAELNEKLFYGKKSPFNEGYKLIMEYIGQENWIKAMKGDNEDGGINLLKFAKGAYRMFGDNETVKQFEVIVDTFSENKTFRDLTNKEKNKFLELLGFNGSGYEKNSLGNRFYNSFSNPEYNGQKDFYNFFSSFKDYVANAMAEVHDPVLKYIENDDYWKTEDVKINTTSNSQKGGKMEFTLNYKGIGDTTSNASKQTEIVEVPDKFNPYQTIAKHQSEVIQNLGDKIDSEKLTNSGKILGKDQLGMTQEDLIAYDGKGNYQDYKNVNNSYKIVWENISNNPESPYWVITSIRCFNEHGEEFYNIY